MEDFQTLRHIALSVLNGTASEQEKHQLKQFLTSVDKAAVKEKLFPESIQSNSQLQLRMMEKMNMLNAIRADQQYEGGLPSAPVIYAVSRKRLLYAAACFLVLFLGGAIAFFVPVNEKIKPLFTAVSTSNGQQRKVLLSDGTQILMNAGSELRYPDAWSDSLREVFLEGEAFFQVSKDSKRPFIIHSGEMSTRVLGTSFNVRAYAEEAIKTIQVKTGRVLVGLENPGHEKLTNEMIVTPDKQVQYTIGSGSGLLLSNIKNDDIASWIGHKFIFSDQPLSAILKELERVYNVSFRINAADEINSRYTIRFDRLPVEQALETIHLLTGLQFEHHTSFITVNPPKNSMRKK